MKLLITILTSDKLLLLKKCYQSLKMQLKSNLSYDIVIIVNSLNKNYKNKVREIIKDCEIIETESNGKPGKGHNSTLNLFREREEYDYLLKIDGDDTLYPFALQRLEKYLKYKPDILNNMYHDGLGLTMKETKRNAPHINIGDKFYLKYNFDEITVNIYYNDFISPFENNIYNTYTPGHILVYSRKAVGYNIKFDETMDYYEDLFPFLQSFELFLQNKIKMVNVLDSKLYLYNMVKKDKKNKEDKFFYISSKQRYNDIVFRRNIKNKFQLIRDWDLRKIPVIEIDKNPLLKEKIAFCEKLFNTDEFKSRDIPLYNTELFYNYAIQNNLDGLKEIYKQYI